MTLQLLRCHVLHCADERALCRRNIGLRRERRQCRRRGSRRMLGEPEIQQLGTDRGKHDVARFQITVNDAVAMRRVERIRDFDRNAQCLSELQARAYVPQALGERLTLEVLEH